VASQRFPAPLCLRRLPWFTALFSDSLCALLQSWRTDEAVGTGPAARVTENGRLENMPVPIGVGRGAQESRMRALAETSNAG